MPVLPTSLPRRPLTLRQRGLYALTALLGVGTIWVTARIVHDTSQQRLAVQFLARTAAERLATHAGIRLELLTQQAFAPAGPWLAADRDASVILGELRQWQEQGAACACRDLLPVAGFFRYDVLHDSIAVAPFTPPDGPGTGAGPGDALPPSDRLAAVARSEVERAAGRRAVRAHLVTRADLRPWATVVMVQPDAAGQPRAVLGAIVPVRPLLDGLFAPDTALARGHEITAGAGHVPPEARVMAVHTGDSLPAAHDSASGFAVATVRPLGVLEGLTVTAALSPEHQRAVGTVGARRRQLWALGALLASTLLALGLVIRSLRQEAALAQARSDFIAGVSHDLRMPLAQLLLASETLTQARPRDPGEDRGLATSILRETRRLIALVENVLLVSRTGAVALAPNVRAVPVRDLLADTQEAVGLLVEDAGQTLAIAPDGDLRVRGDPRLLQQALVNLVDNAVKYGRDGQTIQLTAEAVAGGVQLRVRDAGPGIPAEERERLFRPYARLTRDQASERTGTGLGLAVVRQIAEAHHGRVWIEETSGPGTTVVLEVPTAPAAAEGA